MERTHALAGVEEAIGYTFDDIGLLTSALTHSSFASENDVESYERLEFLGDAVLEIATTSYIFATLPESAEGRMTRVRASVVDEATLASVARSIDLPSAIRLGIGEERNGGRARSSIQSDVVEAVLGAVFLDGGYKMAFDVVSRLFRGTMDERMADETVTDPRSDLQERLAKSGDEVAFAFERSGPDHAVVYTATATVDEAVIGNGSGASKKAAAIDASRNALRGLEK